MFTHCEISVALGEITRGQLIGSDAEEAIVAATQHLISPFSSWSQLGNCGVVKTRKLRDQNFVVLYYLTERAGKFVSKEELLKSSGEVPR
jgi:hypothetical protein